jgi:hypothetical protein
MISEHTDTIPDPPNGMSATEQWEIVDPLFETYLTRLCSDDIDGQLSRRAAVAMLRQKQAEDSEVGTDDTARPMICTLLRQLDADLQAKRASRATTANTMDGIWRLLHALSPAEVATLFEGIVSKLDIEATGSPVAAFCSGIEKWKEKNLPAAKRMTQEPEVTEVDAVSFSEDQAERIVDRMFSR